MASGEETPRNSSHRAGPVGAVLNVYESVVISRLSMLHTRKQQIVFVAALDGIAVALQLTGVSLAALSHSVSGVVSGVVVLALIITFVAISFYFLGQAHGIGD